MSIPQSCMENLWLEFFPELGAARIYCRDTERFQIETRIDRLIASCGDERLEFPLSSGAFVSPKETIGETTIVSVKVADMSVEDVSKFYPESALFEDWSRVGQLFCRNCRHPINSIDWSDLTPCLLPSATWGFEDMRVCEECGPLVVGDIRSHRHGKKSKRKNLFVDIDSVFVEFEDGKIHCDDCGFPLGTNKLKSLEKLKGVVSDVSKIIEFEKKNLVGPKFLETYQTFEDFSRIVEFVTEENDSKEFPLDPKYFRILSRRRDEVIVVPASTNTPVWGIRIMYHDDSLSEMNLARFATQSALKKNWKSTVLAPISPIIVEM